MLLASQASVTHYLEVQKYKHYTIIIGGRIAVWLVLTRLDLAKTKKYVVICVQWSSCNQTCKTGDQLHSDTFPKCDKFSRMTHQFCRVCLKEYFSNTEPLKSRKTNWKKCRKKRKSKQIQESNFLFGKDFFHFPRVLIRFSNLPFQHSTVHMLIIKFCRWLDSNCGPLVSEATALPTERQPLTKIDFQICVPCLLQNQRINLDYYWLRVAFVNIVRTLDEILSLKDLAG